MAAVGLWRRAPGRRAGSQTSARVSIFPGDDLGGEVHAGGSIDLQSARGAPAGELCRIDINTLGDRALTLQLSFRFLGAAGPLVVGGGELRRMDEEDEGGIPARSPVPGHAQGSDRALCHGASLARAEPAVTPLAQSI